MPYLIPQMIPPKEETPKRMIRVTLSSSNSGMPLMIQRKTNFMMVRMAMMMTKVTKETFDKVTHQTDFWWEGPNPHSQNINTQNEGDVEN